MRQKMWHWLFWVWFIWLNIMVSSSCLFPLKMSWFWFSFQLNQIPLCTWITLFIYLSVDRNLCLLHFLVIVKSAAINEQHPWVWVATLVGSGNLGSGDFKLRQTKVACTSTCPHSTRQLIRWGVFWQLNKVKWAKVTRVSAVQSHRTNSCLETSLKNKRCWAIWNKPTPTSYTWEGHKSTSQEQALLEEAGVTRLLPHFLGVTAQARRNLLTQLHSWTMFQQVCN